jgi:hypothetical protein
VASRGRHVLALLGLVLVAAALVLGPRLAANHAEGWEWTLTPSAAPPKIRFEDRDYNRGGEQSGGLPDDLVPVGETPGGGQIFKSSRASGTSTLVYVEDGESVYVYGLIGGP